MTPLTIDELLDAAIDDLMRARTALPDARRRLRDGLAGQPKSSSGGGQGGSSIDEEGGPPVSDPTGEAAIQSASGRDGCAEALRRIDGLIRSTARKADSLITELAAAQHRGPTAKERRETDVANAPPGCKSCARDGGYWEPLHRGDLCRWCDQWLGIHGREKGRDGWPPPEKLQAHHRGQKVRVKAS